jgi:hypothetical protein
MTQGRVVTRSVRTQTRFGAVAALLCLATACGSTVQVQGTALQNGGSDGLPGSGSANQGTTGDGQQSATTGAGTAGGGTTGSTSGTPTGGSSTTGGAGGGPSTTSGGSTTGTLAPGAIPASGRGWDSKSVYVGVPTADDFDKVVKGAGGSSSNGSVRGDVDAIVADINRSGGIHGRKLVAVYRDAATTDYAYNPAGTAQAMCTYFTQDRPVVAVISGSPQLDSQAAFHRCLESKKTTLLSLTNTDFSDADYASLGPHLWTTAGLSTDILVPTFVAGLKRQGFFTGWDVRTSTQSSAPVRVGLLLPDSPQGRHVQKLMAASLKQAGVTLATTFFYDPVGLGQKSQAEVLQFSSANVTHVLDLPPVAAEVWLFQGAAEQQQYRPRYGFTSFNLPLAMTENSGIVPPRQQIGSMGIGWQPYNDVNAAKDPGPVPGRKRCLDALSKGGQTFSSSQRRQALIGVQLCDSLYVLRDALVAGRGLDGSAFLNGMPLAGPKFATAGTFGSTLSRSNHGVPGFYRDQQYQTACSCFVYTGGNHPFTR